MTQPVAEAVPFLLLGDTRRRAIADYVRSGVERWRRAWSQDPKPRVSVEVGGTEFLTGRWSGQSCFQVNSTRASGLWMFVATRCMPVICGIQGMTVDSLERHPEPEGLAARLERESLQRLARELLGAQAHITSFERTPLSVAAAARQLGPARYAVAAVTLGEAETTFSIALPPGLSASLSPTTGTFKPDERVQSRKSALTDQSVGVEVVLGHTEVSIRDLAQLSVGDVIVMDEPLTGSGSLEVQGSGRVGRVSFGQVDGLRAVQFRGKFQ
jgi:flagellar motor switch/type III secretory pathway protein FliN